MPASAFNTLPKSHYYIFLDEVGRGCLSGPVVVAGALWERQDKSGSWKLLKDLGVDDSKKISANGREDVLKKLQIDPFLPWQKVIVGGESIFLAMAQNEAPQIETLNITGATLEAMFRVVKNLLNFSSILSTDSVCVVVDGKVKIPNLDKLPFNICQVAIPKADSLFAPMGLASICAKVYRDYQMNVWEKIYPGYGHPSHKGYGTEEHREKICQQGASPIHRRTFAGVKEFLPPGP